jgi:hypothetical protein
MPACAKGSLDEDLYQGSDTTMQDYLSMAAVPLNCGASSQLRPGPHTLLVCFPSNYRITSPFKGLAHWEPDQSRSHLGHRLKRAQHSLEHLGTVVHLATDGDYCNSCETSGLQLSPPTVLALSYNVRAEMEQSFSHDIIFCSIARHGSGIYDSYPVYSLPPVCPVYIVLI